MTTKRLHELFQAMAEGSADTSIEAAKEIINSAPDRAMTREIETFTLAMLNAKTSIDQDNVTNALKMYIKKQMSLLFIQAFTYGQKYQYSIDKVLMPVAFEKAIEESQLESSMKEEQNNDQEA